MLPHGDTPFISVKADSNASSAELSSGFSRDCTGTDAPGNLLSLAIKRISSTDPLAVVEVSLTPVKYAFYQASGYIFLRVVGYTCPTTTILSSTACGFVGGAVFTVPYLILLLVDNEHVGEDPGSFSQHIVLLSTEMLYSAVASGVGTLVLEGWSARGGLDGAIRGFVGSFISMAFLCVMLEIFLGAVWIGIEFKGWLLALRSC